MSLAFLTSSHLGLYVVVAQNKLYDQLSIRLGKNAILPKCTYQSAHLGTFLQTICLE